MCLCRSQFEEEFVPQTLSHRVRKKEVDTVGGCLTYFFLILINWIHCTHRLCIHDVAGPWFCSLTLASHKTTVTR